jgi:hypothetical protein
MRLVELMVGAAIVLVHLALRARIDNHATVR